MKNYYATFGVDTPFCNRYVRIIAENEAFARNKMFDRFGKKWAMFYDEESFLPQIERFGLSELEVLG